MCFQTQLILEFTKSDVYWNQRILEEVRKRATFHHASVFARYPWPVITAEDPEHVQDMQCGFVPKHMPDAAGFLKQYSTYNAKSETMYDLRTFSKAAKEGRRCLIPVTGFFEWMHVGKEKVPHFIHHAQDRIFHIGGLYENGTYTILTTEANTRMAEIHNSKRRMPVIIPEGHERDWLNPHLTQEEVLALCAPAANGYLTDWTISKLITSRGVETNVPAVWAPHPYPTQGPAPDQAARLFPA